MLRLLTLQHTQYHSSVKEHQTNSLPFKSLAGASALSAFLQESVLGAATEPEGGASSEETVDRGPLHYVSLHSPALKMESLVCSMVQSSAVCDSEEVQHAELN